MKRKKGEKLMENTFLFLSISFLMNRMDSTLRSWDTLYDSKWSNEYDMNHMNDMIGRCKSARRACSFTFTLPVQFQQVIG